MGKAKRTDNLNSSAIEQFTKRIANPSWWEELPLETAVDQILRMNSYRPEMNLENQIRESLMDSSVSNRIRPIFRDDISRDARGMEARLPGEGIIFLYPSLIMTGGKETYYLGQPAYDKTAPGIRLSHQRELIREELSEL